MIKKLKEDEFVVKLLERSSHPTVEDIRPLFKKYNIETAPQLWELFDLIRNMWLEKKSYESDGY